MSTARYVEYSNTAVSMSIRQSSQYLLYYHILLN